MEPDRSDMWILKLDETWNILWQKALGRVESSEGLPQISATMDGGFVAAAEYWLPDIAEEVTVIMKFDADGNVLWQKAYDDGNVNRIFAIIETRAGELLAAGTLGSVETRISDLWIMKLAGTGEILWEEKLEPPLPVAHIAGASQVIEKIGGGYIVAATTSGFGEGLDDMWIVRIDEGGSIVWQRTLGDIMDDGARSIVETSDGGIVVAGYTTPPEHSLVDDADAVLAKLDGEGSILWQKIMSNRFLDDPIYIGESPGAIAESADGGIIFAGSVGWAGTYFDMTDLWMGKLTAESEIEGGCDLIQEGDLVSQESTAIVVDTSSTMYEVSIPVRDANAATRDTSFAPTFLCYGM